MCSSRCWRATWVENLLDRGIYSFVTQIAEAERISKSYLMRNRARAVPALQGAEADFGCYGLRSSGDAKRASRSGSG